MANHLTRVLKLSVEASRTLTGRERKKYYKTSFKQPLEHFFIKSLILNKCFFQPKPIILPCLNTTACMLVISQFKNYINHLETFTKKTEPVKVHAGTQATLLHVLSPGNYN